MSDDEDRYQLTDKGIDVARVAVEMFKLGYSYEEIAGFLGLTTDEFDDAVLAVRLIIHMAELQGVLD